MMKKALCLLLLGTLVILAQNAVRAAEAWNPYQVHKTTTAPTIDGTIGATEWNAATITMKAGTLLEMGGSSGSVLYAWPGETDDNDLSGVFYMMWDATWFYVGVQVKDEAIHNMANQGQGLNGTDVMQLCLDYNNTGAKMNEDDSVTIHDVTPGQKDNATAAAYWQHWSLTGGNEVGYPGSFPNAKFASHLVTGGYELELALKWADMAGKTAPAIGQEMGYMTMLMDFDPPAGGGDPALNELWWNGGNGVNQIGDAALWNKLKLADVKDTTPVNAARKGWTLFH